MGHTITRRLDHTLGLLEEKYNVLYCDQDYQLVLRDMANAKGGYWTQNASILRAMLEKAGLPCERPANHDTAYYQEVIANYIKQGLILTKAQLGERLMSICESLAQEYAHYPTPSAYMERLVNRLSKPEDPWQSDSLRLRILKQFIKYGNYGLPMLQKGSPKKKIKEYVRDKLQQAKVSEQEILDHVDDAVFEHIQGCDLLETCQALASGQFHTNGGAKKDLYLFAFIYDMTYYSKAQASAVYSEERDIGKNLFQDYYATNLMQVISQIYSSKPTASALDPADCSINYRNFAEVICLYYLCQDIKPADKIKCADRMIRELTVSTHSRLRTDAKPAKENAALAATGQSTSDTIMMRERIYGTDDNLQDVYAEDIMALPEEDFKAFIQQYYSPQERDTHSSCSPFVVNAFGHTAADEFRRMIQQLEENGYLEADPYGLFFDDVRRPEASPAPNDDYHRILQWVDERLRKYLSYQGKETIGRTTLLAAYYYMFNATNAIKEQDDEGLLTWRVRSFPEHYEAFRRGADQLFAKVGFAPFSHKNLLDLIIVVSSYLYIYA